MDKCQNGNTLIYNTLPYPTELLGKIGKCPHIYKQRHFT